jgi:hypothetical protein
MEGIVERSPPIFPYPVVARYSGKGDQGDPSKAEGACRGRNG